MLSYTEVGIWQKHHVLISLFDLEAFLLKMYRFFFKTGIFLPEQIFSFKVLFQPWKLWGLGHRTDDFFLYCWWGWTGWHPFCFAMRFLQLGPLFFPVANNVCPFILVLLHRTITDAQGVDIVSYEMHHCFLLVLGYNNVMCCSEKITMLLEELEDKRCFLLLNKLALLGNFVNSPFSSAMYVSGGNYRHCGIKNLIAP